ncbi:MAG: FMN-binding negative transcriptional regulator [Caldimonas sp.]
MYLPGHFAESRPEVLHAFVEAHPFGLLVTNSVDGQLDSNGIPFLLDADPAGGPGILRGHVARANPLWQAGRAEGESLVVFQGPHAYVSPSWYPTKSEHGKVVPTWNYCMVQARGPVRAIEDAAWLHAFVSRLTDRHEQGRAGPWAVSDAPADYVTSMLRAIVGIEIVLVALTGKWKVTQNRSAADREGVARGLVAEAAGPGAELAAQVRDPGSP